jgi:hypothetical protein
MAKTTGILDRQRASGKGAPLSPYLFILAKEFLTKAFDRTMQEGEIKGIRLTPGVPNLTHALYADDLILFMQTTLQEISVIKEVIKEFG